MGSNGPKALATDRRPCSEAGQKAIYMEDMYYKDGVRPKGNHSVGMRNGKYVKIYKFSPPTDGLGRSPSPIILIE